MFGEAQSGHSCACGHSRQHLFTWNRATQSFMATARFLSQPDVPSYQTTSRNPLEKYPLSVQPRTLFRLQVTISTPLNAPHEEPRSLQCVPFFCEPEGEVPDDPDAAGGLLCSPNTSSHACFSSSAKVSISLLVYLSLRTYHISRAIINNECALFFRGLAYEAGQE